MKITRESWVKATAEAMSTVSAKELFKSDSQIESLFTDYSFHLYIRMKDKDLTESEFNEIVANVHIKLLTELDTDTRLNMVVNLALMIFATQIWTNLISQSEQDETNKEYENFKSVLKSQKSE